MAHANKRFSDSNKIRRTRKAPKEPFSTTQVFYIPDKKGKMHPHSVSCLPKKATKGLRRHWAKIGEANPAEVDRQRGMIVG